MAQGPNIGSGLTIACSLSILWFLGESNTPVATHMLPPNYQGIQDSRAIIKHIHSRFLPRRPRAWAYSELVLFLKKFWELQPIAAWKGNWQAGKLAGTECFANVSFLGINQLRAFACPSLLIKHRYRACLSRPITQCVRKQTDRLHFLASHCCISPSAEGG